MQKVSGAYFRYVEGYRAPHEMVKVSYPDHHCRIIYETECITPRISVKVKIVVF